jgi:hypothetical protein
MLASAFATIFAARRVDTGSDAFAARLGAFPARAATTRATDAVDAIAAMIFAEEIVG